MRERLADSLDYVFGEIGDELGTGAVSAADTTSQIRSAPQSPHRFGAYYDMVLAVELGELEQARQFAAELTSLALSAGLSIASIEDRNDRQTERYRRLFLDDPALAGEPDPVLLADTKARIDAGFALLDRGFPEMAGEIRALLREIVIAAGPEDPKALTFDGSSSYMLWGATLLNARGPRTVLDTAQALAHESGHNLLFGYCASGPLVENPDEDLFESPLRIDPRPMDGIVHATYVIARMHQTLERLLEAGILTADESRSAAGDLAAHRRNFEAGDSVIRKSGRLTDLGRDLIESAREYMGEAAVARCPAQTAIPA